MSSRPKTVELHFPVGGMDRRYGYQRQAPYNTFDCLNVWPADPLEGRERGGSRPGTSKALASAIGYGEPVQLLASVATVAGDASLNNVLAGVANGAVFYSSGGADWTACGSGVELLTTNAGFETFTGTADDATSDTWTGWTASVGDGKTLAMSDSVHGGTYSCKLLSGPTANTYVMHDALTVVAGRSMRLTFWTRGDGTNSGRHAVKNVDTGGYIVALFTENGVPGATYTQVTVDFQVPAGCTQIRTLFHGPDADAGYCYVDDVSVVELSHLNQSATVLTAAPRGQKLYIGDYRPTRIYSEDGVIASANRLSDSADNPDWTTLSIDIDRDVAIVTFPGTYTTATIKVVNGVVTLAAGNTFPAWAANGDLTVEGGTYEVNTRDSDTQLTLVNTDLDVDEFTSYSLAHDVDGDDVYAISAVAAGYITIDGTLPNEACTYEIGRKIKVFDPSDNTVGTIAATYGIPPVNCPVVFTYRDRIVACQGNIVYMSRSGDPDDWDYGYTPEDPNRPWASTITDQAGYVGDPIRAGFAHSDDFAIFAGERSIYLMRGDPAGGGRIDSISQEVGIISSTAWCKLSDASVVFLSRQGLRTIAPGSTAEPQPWSTEVLPRELLDVDVTANTVAISYDGRLQGIHLFITPTDGSTGEHYFVSPRTRGIFPVGLQDAQQPTCVLPYAADQGSAEHVLQGCHDGYVRRYDSTATQDDGSVDISSYVIIGPLRLAPPGFEGAIVELGATLDEDSADVTGSLMVGDTGEAVCDSGTADYTVTLSAGCNGIFSPRVRGQAAKLKLATTGAWAMESAFMSVRPAGRMR